MKKFFIKSSLKIHFILEELAILLKGGLPLSRALEILALQRREASKELLQIKHRIEEGKEISIAFKESQIFPEFVCEMLKAAQTGENLENIFLKSAQWIAQIEDFKNQISKSLIYPSIVITLSILGIVIILEFVIPRIEKILLSFGKDLPFFTKMLILVAHLLWWVILLGLPLGVFLFWYYSKKRKASPNIYKFLLKIPLIKEVWLYFDLARFCYTAGILLDTGIVLPRAIKVAGETCQNLYLKQIFLNSLKFLEEGKFFSSYICNIEILPPFLKEIIKIGEEAGTLPEMLKNASQFFTKELEARIDFILKWIEPLTILILGSIIAYTILSVILPIMEITTAIKIK